MIKKILSKSKHSPPPNSMSKTATDQSRSLGIKRRKSSPSNPAAKDPRQVALASAAPKSLINRLVQCLAFTLISAFLLLPALPAIQNESGIKTIEEEDAFTLAEVICINYYYIIIMPIKKERTLMNGTVRNSTKMIRGMETMNSMFRNPDEKEDLD
jgi:hypothetical protein